ncbi:hypothetical protein [Flavobacterium sp. XS1P27]|uniref:hypothetical protein n=1 Tax=Flavobacterium sp. XS1P27 TaxID=3401724 RepID=UPI003AAC23DE
MKENNFFSKYYFLSVGLSTYPVSLLLSINFQNTDLIMYLIPIVVVYLFSSVVYLLFFLFKEKLKLKNFHLSVSIITIIFFTYGILYSYLYESRGLLGRHRFLIPLPFILIFITIYIVNKLKEKGSSYYFAIIFLSILNVIPFVTLITKGISIKSIKPTQSISLHKTNAKKLPNIYYIILDGYGSGESMKKLFNYDNSNFTDQLKYLDFEVQEKAKSNFNLTVFSLSSTLNLNYIQDIIKGNIYENEAQKLISNNAVLKTLERYGYYYYIFDSGFGLKKQYKKNEVLVKTYKDNTVEDFLFATSGQDVLNSFISNSMLMVYKYNLSLRFYSERILNVFKRLPEISKIPERKFVFVHILSPHPPYLFDENGKYKANSNENWNADLHIKQLKFINAKTLLVLKSIIKNDKSEKIIILQGDHGSRIIPKTKVLSLNQKWVHEEYSILNAIYISKKDKSREIIYNNWKHSSVNSFRIIFNEYFNYKLPLLNDKKYDFELKKSYHFNEIK